jgi:hypothetical protein
VYTYIWSWGYTRARIGEVGCAEWTSGPAYNDSLKRGTVFFLFQGAHFSRDTINRPGFAKLFFDAASEERQHAIKIISYLLMRGELTSEVSKLIQNPVSNPNR